MISWKPCFVAFQFLAFQWDNAGVVIGSIAAGLATAYGIYIKSYEGSFKQQLDSANWQINLNTAEINTLKADREVVKADRDAAKADRDFWKAESEGLRAKLVERDRTIEERDRTIAARDLTIDEQVRITRRMGADVADMAEAFLIRKGDAKSRVHPS